MGGLCAFAFAQGRKKQAQTFGESVPGWYGAWIKSFSGTSLVGYLVIEILDAGNLLQILYLLQF